MDKQDNRCPACGKFMSYGRMSNDINEYGRYGWCCKCGYERDSTIKDLVGDGYENYEIANGEIRRKEDK